MPDPLPPGAGTGSVAPPMAAILRHGRAPFRTWSVVMTVFGDAVLPRGGVLAVRPLLDILAAMGIGGGAVRTALSRLSADGWLQATRVGRNSLYRLTPDGQAAAVAASARIYHPPGEGWDGRMTVLLPGGGTAAAGVRDALGAAGFGALAPGVWIAPASVPVPPGTGLLPVEAVPCPETGRRLAEQAWPLAATAEAYDRFLHAFTPLQRWTAEGGPLADGDAMVARILLVHEYRRLALRDPRLPAALLPADWPGTRAWTLCSRTYPALLPGSERWLDTEGQGPDGPLPPASDELGQRFRPRDRVTDFP